MSDEPAELNEDEEFYQDNNDWENRVLCSDESCIGVIGPDGRCKECGKPGEVSKAAEMDADEEDDAPQDDIQEQSERRFDDDWESRTLCSDESCIGVIGPDGRCKECGKPYEE
jgi:hypothetical protein